MSNRLIWVDRVDGEDSVLANDVNSIAHAVQELDDISASSQTQITNLENNKVDKVDGKGLSSNDLTDDKAAVLDKFNVDSTGVILNFDGVLKMGSNSHIVGGDLQSVGGVICYGDVLSNVAGAKIHTLSRKADVDEVRTILPNVKTSLPSSGQMSLNTIYDLRCKTASDTLSLNLPSGDVGNFIQVDFVTGDSVPTLLIDATSAALVKDYDFSLEPNMIYSLFFDYGILDYAETTSGLQTQIGYTYGWRFNYAEYTYKNESE